LFFNFSKILIDINLCFKVVYLLISTKYYTMSLLRKYEIMILLTEEFNDSELKTWVFNYAKSLRKFNVCDISVISRGKHNLAYPITTKSKGNYIQLNFSSMPKYINTFLSTLKMDSNVLRFLVLNKQA
jgi:ribosomal protein S6